MQDGRVLYAIILFLYIRQSVSHASGWTKASLTSVLAVTDKGRDLRPFHVDLVW